MISVIIAARNEALLLAITKNINETIGVEYEIISVRDPTNKKGICEKYNEGAKNAKFPYLCFVHEDIIFHTSNWGKNLINHLSNPGISLIGVLGNIVKTLTPSGAFIFNSDLVRINHLQRTKNGNTEFYNQNPLNEIISEVKVLDGMFLATTKKNFLKYPFDETLLNGFHGYDVDFSLGQAKNGKLLVVYDILLEHFSYGNYTVEWIDAQEKVTKKWRNQLPCFIDARKSEIKAAEIKNLEQLLRLLFIHNYNKKKQFKYFSKLLLLKPIKIGDFYLFRKLLIYGKIEKHIKSILPK